MIEPLAAELLAAIPADVRAICQRLREHGFRGWIVGGCVRDLLRGHPASDWDVATDALPEDVVRTFRKVIPTGIQHGTVTVMLGKQGYELTTLRGEGEYSDGRRPDKVEFVSEIEADLSRRDFTFNAMAIEPITGALVDPFNGREDLDARIVRAVGAPLDRFREDGLRVLRAARFAAALECEVDPATERAMGAASTLATLRRVSAERVRDEWLKTMKARKPSVAFELMRKTGILEVICPELAACVGCSQGRDDPFDVWGHTMATLDAAPAEPLLRLAALVHDIGKPRARREDPVTGAVAFPEHAQIGSQMAGAVAMRLKLSNDERAAVAALVHHHVLGYDDGWSDGDVRRWIRRVTPSLLPRLFSLALANATGRGLPGEVERGVREASALRARAEARLAAGDPLTTRELAIRGNELMTELGLAPGRAVGEILETLLESVLDDPSRNARSTLMDLARAHIAARPV